MALSLLSISIGLIIPAVIYFFATRPSKQNQIIEIDPNMSNTVVVLGASYAGLAVAHSLLKHTLPSVKNLKVVVVAPNTHLYWNLASVRAIVPGQMSDDKLLKEIAPGFKQYPQASYELITGTATGVDPTSKNVTISTPSGERVQAYTHLVVATGSRSTSNVPWKDSLEGSEKTKQVLHEYQEKVKSAKKIVVAGAGPTGVETAAELAFEYKGKKEIVLITSGKTVLVGLPPSVIKFAEGQLATQGVKVITGAKVTGELASGSGVELSLSTGEKLPADLYLPTVGVTPNTEFLPKSLLNGRGDVVVDEYLKVKGVEGIWAAGDVVDVQPSQMAYAAAQAKALHKNLDRILKGQQPIVYKTDGAPMIAVTLGRSKGTGRMGNMKLPSIMVYFVKGKTLFSEKLPKYISGAEF